MNSNFFSIDLFEWNECQKCSLSVLSDRVTLRLYVYETGTYILKHCSRPEAGTYISAYVSIWKLSKKWKLCLKMYTLNVRNLKKKIGKEDTQCDKVPRQPSSVWRRHLNSNKAPCCLSGAFSWSFTESSSKWIRKGVFLTLQNVVLHEQSWVCSGLWRNLAKIWEKGVKMDLLSQNNIFIKAQWISLSFFLDFQQIILTRSDYFCLCGCKSDTWKRPYYLRIKHPVSINFHLD